MRVVFSIILSFLWITSAVVAEEGDHRNGAPTNGSRPGLSKPAISPQDFANACNLDRAGGGDDSGLNGQTLFQQRCLSCHSPGSGKPVIADLNGRPLAAKKLGIVANIMNGRMPKGSTLGSADRERLITYINQGL